MEKIIKLFIFVVSSAFFGVIMVTSMALVTLESQQQLLRDTPLLESDLVVKNMRGWLVSEGLASDLIEDIVDQFRSSAELMSTTSDYNATIAQQLEDFLNIARLFSVVGVIILALGFMIYPQLKKRYQ
jgi:hypothetical protein